MLNFEKTNTFNNNRTSGHSSVVERLVANEKVEGSSPFARSKQKRRNFHFFLLIMRYYFEMYKLIIGLIIFFPSICFASSMKMIGEKGNIKDVTKVINVKMFDNYYEPNEITVKKGETVKFIVTNMGELVHELNIATKEMHIKHQPEMARMVEHEILLADRIDKNKMKEMAKMDHSMAHKHANSVLLEPSNTGEIIWKFSTSAKLEIACNVPGHYEAGMIAKIIKY